LTDESEYMPKLVLCGLNMKSLPILAGLFLLATGCTTIHRLDSTKCKVVPVPQGVQDPAKFEDISKRISQGNTVILKVAQGERMPFKLTMDLPMGTLEKSEYTFVFKQDMYFLLSQKKFHLSPDGQRWASIDSPHSLAKLFGVKHGEFSLSFSSATNERPFMSVDLKAKGKVTEAP
jgi:hypothetical protein